MKITKTTWMILSIIIAVLFGTYFYTFSGKLSVDSQDWANFGTYIGGTLGPIGAFLAFWGLMQQNTMYKQNSEIERLSTKLTSLDSDILILTGKCFITSEGWKLKHGMSSRRN